MIDELGEQAEPGVDDGDVIGDEFSIAELEAMLGDEDGEDGELGAYKDLALALAAQALSMVNLGAGHMMSAESAGLTMLGVFHASGMAFLIEHAQAMVELGGDDDVDPGGDMIDGEDGSAELEEAE